MNRTRHGTILIYLALSIALFNNGLRLVQKLQVLLRDVIPSFVLEVKRVLSITL